MRPGYWYLLRKYTRWAHPWSGFAHVADEVRSRRPRHRRQRRWLA